MNKKTDPFTRTPGIAGKAFIDMHYADKIIDSFENDNSSKFVYKIVGLRGSGKSVEYGKVMKHFKKNKSWIVATLSAAGNPTETLISKLSKEEYIGDTKNSTTISSDVSLGGHAGIVSGGVNTKIIKTSEYNDKYYSAEATLSEMVNIANDKGYKILVGIDDISKTSSMVEFLSIFGAMILDSKKIYLLCTGLNKNIEDFSNEDNLSFFKRSDSVEIGNLDRYEIAQMYQDLLKINMEESVVLAKFVKGYAYAYQVLGSLYYNKNESEKLEDLIPKFNKILFKDSYDLIWKSLSPSEKDLVKCILYSKTQLVNEIKELMDKPQNFSSLRNRLEYKHILNTEERGKVTIDLPQFKDFVDLWENE